MTAYLVARAVVVTIGLPLPIGIVSGAVIEFLGMNAVNTLLVLFNYNRRRNKTHEPAPVWIAAIMAAVYFVAVFVLTCLVDAHPVMRGFPILSVVSSTLIALRADHKRRLDAIEADRAERSANRSAGRSGARAVTGQGRTVTGQVNGQPEAVSGQAVGALSAGLTGATGQNGELDRANRARNVNRAQAEADALVFIQANPYASMSQIGAAVDRSKAWAVGYTDRLEAAGKLHKNGNGWELRE